MFQILDVLQQLILFSLAASWAYNLVKVHLFPKLNIDSSYSIGGFISIGQLGSWVTTAVLAWVFSIVADGTATFWEVAVYGVIGGLFVNGIWSIDLIRSLINLLSQGRWIK